MEGQSWPVVLAFRPLWLREGPTVFIGALLRRTRWSPGVATTGRRDRGRRRGIPSPSASSSPEATASDSSVDISAPNGLRGRGYLLLAGTGPPMAGIPDRFRGTFSLSSGGTREPGRSRVERGTGSSGTGGVVESVPPVPLSADSVSSLLGMAATDPSAFRTRGPSASKRRRARRVRGRPPSSSEELPSLSTEGFCCCFPPPPASRPKELSCSKAGGWLGRGDGGFLGGRPLFRLGGEGETAVGQAGTEGGEGGGGGERGRGRGRGREGGGGGGKGGGGVRLSVPPPPGMGRAPGVGGSLALGGRPRLRFSTGDATNSAPLALSLGTGWSNSCSSRPASPGDLFLGGRPRLRFKTGRPVTSCPCSPFSGLSPPELLRSIRRRAGKGRRAWGGRVESDRESQEPPRGGEDSGSELLRVEELPGLTPISEAPVAGGVEAGRCCRRLRTSSFSSTTVTSLPGSFLSTLGPGGCPVLPVPCPRISTSALVRRLGGRAGEGLSGEEAAEEEADGPVTSDGAEPWSFSGLGNGTRISTGC